jgi:hypothetical protein
VAGLQSSKKGAPEARGGRGCDLMSDVDSGATRRHLEKLLVSDQLGKSEASRKLLTYLVERSLRNDAPKEVEIAVDVFGRGASFNGAEDSVVRVAVRTLRQKLAEYYAVADAHDGLQFVIPKGGYRLTVTPAEAPRAPRGAAEKPAAVVNGRQMRWAFTLVVLCLALSSIGNFLLWNRDASQPADPVRTRIRSSPVWADVVASHRPLTIVLGDLFMFTQVDARTGRTLTVRDTQINSSEELRAFLASNPSFAAERGQRYVSMVQKSAAIGMASILQIVDRPGRRIEVTLRDELTNSQILNNDIIYVGPMSGLGPLFGFYEARSRYRYNAADSTLTDVDSHKSFSPQGVLSAERLDYALAAKFVGPNGNYIMVFTSGVRNAGLLQVVRTLTSPDGLDRLQRNLRAKPGALPDSFEALLTVAGFRQTDLAADIVDVNPLPVRLDAGRLGQRR